MSSINQKCCEKCRPLISETYCSNPACPCHSNPTTGKGKVYLRERAHPDCSCDHEETLPPNNSQKGKPIRMWVCKKHGHRCHDLPAPTTPETPRHKHTEDCVNKMVEELVREYKQNIQRAGWPEEEVNWLRTALTHLAEKTREEGREDALHFMDATIRADEIRASERHRISVEVEKEKITESSFGKNHALPDNSRTTVANLHRRAYNAALTRVQELINPKQNDV